MYLQRLVIKNFRKFSEDNNIIEFASPYVLNEKNKKVELASECNKSIACATTLIIGQNNSGKSTIYNALDYAINRNDIDVNTFNYNKLHQLLQSYIANKNILELDDDMPKDKKKRKEKIEELRIELPKIEFDIIIKAPTKNKNILLTNFVDIIDVSIIKEDVENEIEIKFKIAFEIKETLEFIKNIKSLIIKNKANKENESAINDDLFRDFLKLINETSFIKKIYNINGLEISNKISNLNNIFSITNIAANLDSDENLLSKSFNKIIKFKLNKDINKKQHLEEKLENINKSIKKEIARENNESINKITNKIIDKNKMGVELISDVNFDSAFSKIIHYEFKENGLLIPENQFGLGYKNLMRIISELINYVDNYDETNLHNKVNIIYVEEPENYMHPQMQELFIKNIDDAINTLFNHSKKTINSQMVITTHSSHILNSKIHTGNTFNNINYLKTDEKGYTKSIILSDSKFIKPDTKDKNKENFHELNFIKKRFKFQVSNLFFSDAVIFVEGITEEHLLNYYISLDEELNTKYITIFNINGAYAHVYKPLLERLEIPFVIITDIDLFRKSEEKGEGKEKEYVQIQSLNKKETTNPLIRKYICNNNLLINDNLEKSEKSQLPENGLDYFENKKFKLIFQKDPIENQFASSFEEAFILTNYKNKILNKTLKELKPRIYKEIIGADNKKNMPKNIENSFKWQCKLEKDKSEFTNKLLFNIINKDPKTPTPSLPKYITDALEFIKKNLKP
ncbi:MULTISPECIES: AAA family ATPase [Proteus]|uniref:AAA family ATPase n=2 Tax=Proteus penneri TaxID=102862 RepID=A0ABS0W1R9_9GAMM|nr:MULTISPECIES: AAA family ATPase [Proteus]MBJ2117256.1 AAA family ATPase [Proteus penneri]NBM13871.1 AAA family ATPase [Proteus sp. G2670]NBM33170.1 AAA family ATPase [Proteus sp. G2664]NBM85567.1 AAA family ATPase [Proteus sp. G2661]NBM93426.1 AAA family ATPase [Proteus sp. G2662]